ncbi:MAG: flagellar hook-basal body complex protein FliE [Candidatus Neomarinimicrobiota bacterium]
MNNIGDLTSLIRPSLLPQNNNVSGKTGESGAVESKSFKDTMMDFLKAADGGQKAAADQVEAVVQGDSESLHQAMSALEESRLNFQLLLEIRNKLLDSYKEIQRMQI